MNLLNIFKRKKSYMCPLLNTNLHFTSRNTLEPCCSANIGPAMLDNLSEQCSVKPFLQNKSKYLKMFKDGIIPEGCNGCVHITKYETTTDNKIDKITLNHYTQCNCACIYCTQGNRTLEKIKEDENKPVLYDVLKFINELYDLDMINTETLYVDFQGGNISCLKNYDEILHTFLERGVGTIYIPTNNIVYMPVIEKLLASDKGEMCTALDSGTRETYLRIKQVDKFEKSVDNLKKYIKNAGNDHIIVKYIIVNGYNDNLDEFKQFITLMHSIGVKIIVLDIDYRDIIDKDYTLPKQYYDILNFAKRFCEENNMDFGIPPYTQKVFQQGYSKH